MDARLKASTKAIAEAVKASGSTRPDTVGVGPIIAGRLISRTGRVSRFPTAAAYANYAGTAPVEIASADKSRHRLLGPGSPAQLGPAHHRDHPDPDDRQPRQPLLPGQNHRRQNTTRGPTLPQKPPRQPRLAGHDRRRTHGLRGRPGRTHGGDNETQRGWPNPDSQLFGSVTSRTCHPEHYDHLTNTEAPKGADLSIYPLEHLPPVQDELNRRPRLVLENRSPAELFAALLDRLPDRRSVTGTAHSAHPFWGRADRGRFDRER